MNNREFLLLFIAALSHFARAPTRWPAKICRCLLLMLWTAPPPASECRKCGRGYRESHAHVLPVAELNEDLPPMRTSHDFEVRRDAPSIAAALEMMLRSSSIVLFVDAYYDPFNARYQNTIGECLRIVQASKPNAVCEIHHLDRPRALPAEAIEREARAKFGTVIPQHMTVTIYRWRKKNGGADFHAR